MAETTLFADGIRNVSLSNNVLRVELTQNAGQNEPQSAGTLFIPANQAANVANALNGALRELQQRLQQQQGAQQGQSSQAGGEADELNLDET